MKNQKFVFVLLCADAWHTISSKEVQGIYTTKHKAITEALRLFKADIKTGAESKEITPDEFTSMLENHNQTQGLDRNYIVEKWELNQICLSSM